MKAGLVYGTCACLALAVLACGSGPEQTRVPPEDDVPAEALERARNAADSLGGELMQRLLAELAEGGPVQGVRVCSEVAQSVSAEQSRDGLTVRRVSLRLRNLADAPDAWERGQLEELDALHGDGRLPKEVVEVTGAAGERTLRYLRPILVVQPCLQCHGDPDRMELAVVEMLRERYPDDEAIGYSRGDLRGAISATVRLR
jgi:hypothetical protein